METSKNSTRQLTLDELISLQEGSPVNPTAWPESERERRTSATCGPRCCALFENAPRATSWAKTFAALLVGMEGWSSKRCALTWKLKGTLYNRSYFQLAVSAHPTDGTESGLLLTPTTCEDVRDTDKFMKRMEKYDNRTTVPNLATQVLGMLPTPTTDERDTKYAQGGTNLRAAVKMLPTPTTRDHKGARSLEAREAMQQNSKRGLTLSDVHAETGKTSQLSPLFVEEMMGFPKNWTASPFQGGDEKA